MTDSHQRITVLHGKFAAYLAWSQPFIYQLVQGVGEHVNNLVVCNRTENLDRFPTPNIVRLKNKYLVKPSLAVLASAYLQRAHSPTLMHAHFGWSGIRMLLLKQFLRIPLVTTFGGRDAAVQMNLPYFDRLYRVLLDCSDQIICVSHDLKRILVEAGVEAHRIEVIRRGTDLKRFAFIDRSDHSGHAPVRLLMVGRLVEKKGHQHALEALRILVDAGQNLRLTIVGEGEDYHRLRKLRDRLGLRSIVEFTGVTNHDGVRQHMSESDIFLHCSVTGRDGDCEGIPNVVMEAAATGLPIIGTRHGGIVEPILEGQSGLLVEEHDVARLAEAIRRLATNRDMRLDMGRVGAKFMRAEFDLDKQVSQHVAIYENLAAAHIRSPIPNLAVPTDFPELIDQTMQYVDNAKEFSLAEMAEVLLGTRHERFSIAKEGGRLLERAYDLKRFVPQPIKFPMKLAMGKAMRSMLHVTRRRDGVWKRRRQILDQRVLDYFMQGGSLSIVSDDWTVNDLSQFLPEDAVVTSSQGRDMPIIETSPTMGPARNTPEATSAPRA